MKVENILLEHRMDAIEALEHFLGGCMNGTCGHDRDNPDPREIPARQIVALFREGKYSAREADLQLYKLATQIRNDEMREKRMHLEQDEVVNVMRIYGTKDFEMYETYLPQFKDLAHEKLCLALGYDPGLKYGLDAEILLRWHCGEGDLDSDHIAKWIFGFMRTIVKYREVLFSEGVEAADNSPLQGGRHYFYEGSF